MTLPFPAETYYDLVEEDARLRIQNLSASVEGKTVSEDVIGVSHDIIFEEQPWETLKHTTTYRTNVYSNIDCRILKHPYPPEYLHVIVGALTTAMVDHHNISRPLDGQLLKPSSDDLGLHLDTIWASFRESKTLAIDDEEAIIYQTPPFNFLRLTLARRAGMLSLDFVHTQDFAKLRFLTESRRRA